MSGLAALMHAIAHAATPDQLKSCVMDGVREALGSEKTGLYLLQSESGRPSEIHVSQLPESFVIGYEQLGRDEDKVLATVLRTGRPVYDEQAFPGDGWKRSVLYRSFGSRYRLRHYLCTPIVGRGTILGTLNLGRSSDHAHWDANALARAAAVGRAIGAKLASFDAPGIEAVDPARLRAIRALLRTRHEQLERSGTRLSPDDAAELWRALSVEAVTPLDWFDDGERRYVLVATDASDLGAAVPLTRREREILAHLAAGDSDKAIAFHFGLTASTVSTHLSAVRRKLGLRSRVALVVAARALQGHRDQS